MFVHFKEPYNIYNFSNVYVIHLQPIFTQLKQHYDNKYLLWLLLSWVCLSFKHREDVCTNAWIFGAY